MQEDIHAFRLVVRIFAQQLYPSLYNMGSAYVYPKYHTLMEHLLRSHGAEALANGTAVVPETREELSELLGLSLRTVYRLCTRLVAEKYARIVKKKIVLTASQVERMSAYLEDEAYEPLA
jgi:CRP-like cAMP-binding protein